MNRYNPQKHNRHSIRLKEHDYSCARFYYVTMRIQNRKCVLGQIINGLVRLNRFGKIVEKFWLHLPVRFENVKLDAFVIMPDHVHGIIQIFPGIINVVVGAIHELPQQQPHQTHESSHHQQPHQTHESSPCRCDRQNRRIMMLPKAIGYFKMNSAKEINKILKLSGNPLWQRNYYEHIVRDKKDLDRIRNYIKNNPRVWNGGGNKHYLRGS